MLVVTGLSGAGKSQALRALEDSGYFCVDNLPPALILKFAELCAASDIRRVALVVDVRGGEFFDTAVEALEELEQAGFPYHILYLEASDEALVRRYKETRRRHPLAPEGSVLEGLRKERELLELLRGRAHRIIDTTELSPQDLRRVVAELFAGRSGEGPRLVVTILSFGFKHGLPLDADLVLDVRFLPNPHYVPSLRPRSGNEEAVRDYVLKWPVTARFLEKVIDLLDFLLPHYENEGKSQLTVAVGCTGGRHRSVVIANFLAEAVHARRYPCVVRHRDLGKGEGEGEAAGSERGSEGA
ncbi:MAG: RNase adapter RapZ [Clostridia bacterium]|nr:RNase adapter RapZ [Clostridia bacterium]